jgi:hypothetical protein
VKKLLPTTTVREPAAPLKTSILPLEPPQTTQSANETIIDEIDKCIIRRKFQEYYKIKVTLS